MTNKSKIFLLMLMLTLSSAWASNDKVVALTRIPQKAQTIIAKHFEGAKVSYVKMENDWFSKSYDVVFNDGNKIEFDRRGEWKEIDCKYSRVPIQLVPTPIRHHVETRHPGTYIVQIDRDNKDYEIELNNGLELIFSLKGEFKGFHD